MIQLSSPYSLQECVRRIQGLNKGGLPPLPAVRVKIYQASEGTFEFTVERWAFLNLVAIIEGEARFVNPMTTTITIETRIALRLRLFLYAYFVVLLIIFLSYIRNGRYGLLPFFVMMLGWGLLMQVAWSVWRDHLINKLIAALG